MTGAERREQITAEIMARTGITEAMIERLVRGFYAKVRSDAVLAPVFEARIADWEPHLAADVRVLVVGRADVGPLPRHADGQAHAVAGRCRSFRSLAGIVRGNRRRDLSAGGRAHFVELARRIAASLELGVAGGQGVMLAPGETISAQRSRSSPMTNQTRVISDKEQANPYSGSSLLPMLVAGLVLTLAGMFAAFALS